MGMVEGRCIHIKQETHSDLPAENVGAEETGDWSKGNGVTSQKYSGSNRTGKLESHYKGRKSLLFLYMLWTAPKVDY